MKTPRFWYQPQGWQAKLLQPLAALYQWGYRLRWRFSANTFCDKPVICVGNVVAGGAGKTPTIKLLAELLLNHGLNVAIVSRGYGAQCRTTHKVQTDDSFSFVGDEPLMLARAGFDVWVGNNRRNTLARAAQNADIVLLDDGLQNPNLHKSFSLLVIDGASGLGNGATLPAGPLRETLHSAIARSNAVLLIGQDAQNVETQLPKDLPLLRAEREMLLPHMPLEQKLVAFAGLGRPEQFFQALRLAGLNIMESYGFADHHPYTLAEAQHLRAAARHHGARLITTAKDVVRLPNGFSKEVMVADLAIQPQPAAALDQLLSEWLHL